MDAFNADVLLLPIWVQNWMNILGLVMLTSTIAFLIRKETRVIGLYILITSIISVAVMVWMHSQMGMVRLLGIVHIVFWTPLVIYLFRRVRATTQPVFYTIIMWSVIIIFTAALVFDYYDVFRWLVGERTPIVTASPQ